MHVVCRCVCAYEATATNGEGMGVVYEMLVYNLSVHAMRRVFVDWRGEDERRILLAVILWSNRQQMKSSRQKRIYHQHAIRRKGHQIHHVR